MHGGALHDTPPAECGLTPRALPVAAVDALCEHNAIDTLLSNFILPLQEDQISTVDPDTEKVTFSLWLGNYSDSVCGYSNTLEA